eukprot:TRINITY_DN14990_c0_g2_i3.p1 TRINITY_DN14990_c0_g2~~TRINITY_DN14990_c0_g2_i3.p1  ORF type:complete len:1426 (-),score=396.40 TRINITY_DN14990_c0_g2_i3:107-4384(-)
MGALQPQYRIYIFLALCIALFVAPLADGVVSTASVVVCTGTKTKTATVSLREEVQCLITPDDTAVEADFDTALITGSVDPKPTPSAITKVTGSSNTFQFTVKPMQPGTVTVTGVLASGAKFSTPPSTVNVTGIEYFTPAGGSSCGNTTVTIYGTLFGWNKDELQSVEVAGMPCDSYTWINNGTVECETTTAMRTGPVRVRSIYGEQVSIDNFQVKAESKPLVQVVLPKSLAAKSSTSIIIAGAHLGANASMVNSVTVAGVPAKDCKWESEEIIRCTAQATSGPALGPVVVNSTASAQLCDNKQANANFFYEGPVINSIEPSEGPAYGAFLATIRGAYFGANPSELLAISLAGAPCLDISHQEPSRIVCKAANVTGPTSGKIAVTTKDGGTGYSGFDFKYVGSGTRVVYPGGFLEPPPQIDKVDPPRLRIQGGQVVTITGKNFGRDIEDLVSIDFNGMECPLITNGWKVDVQKESSGTLLCETKVGEPGLGKATVVTTMGGPGVSAFDVELYYAGFIDVNIDSKVTNEDGTKQAQLSMLLTIRPTYDVTIKMASSLEFEASFSPSELIFYPADYNSPKTSLVLGSYDNYRDGSKSYQIMFTADSNDERFQNKVIPNITMVNEDSTPQITEVIPKNCPLNGTYITLLGKNFDPKVWLTVAYQNVTEGIDYVIRDNYADPGDSPSPLPAGANGTTSAGSDNATSTSTSSGSSTSGDGSSAGPSPSSLLLLGTTEGQYRKISHRQVVAYAQDHGMTLQQTVDESLPPTSVVGVSFRAPPYPDGGYVPVVIYNEGGTIGYVQDILFYTDDCVDELPFGRGEDCQECPVGGICQGGYRIWPKSGFWNSDEDDGRVIECIPQLRCGGCDLSEVPSDCYKNENGAPCGQGYQGFACANCQNNYYAINGICEPCPEFEGLLLLIFMDVLVWLCVAMAAWWLEERENLSRITGFILAVQEVGGVGLMIQNQLPKWLRGLYETFGLFSGDISFMKPSCNQPIEFEKEYYLALGYVVAIAMPLLLGMPVVKYCSLRWHQDESAEFLEDRAKHYDDRWYRCVTIHLMLVYFSTTQRAVGALSCNKAAGDGKWRRTTDQSYECFTPKHFSVYFTALSILIFETFGFPIAYYIWIRKSGDKIFRDRRFAHRWDFLTEPFKANYRQAWFMEVVELFAIALSSTIFANDPNFQLVASGGVFAAVGVFIAAFRPYRKDWENYIMICFKVANVLAMVLIYLVSLGEGVVPKSYLTVIIYIIVILIGIGVGTLGGNVFYNIIIVHKKTRRRRGNNRNGMDSDDEEYYANLEMQRLKESGMWDDETNSIDANDVLKDMEHNQSLLNVASPLSSLLTLIGGNQGAEDGSSHNGGDGGSVNSLGDIKIDPNTATGSNNSNSEDGAGDGTGAVPALNADDDDIDMGDGDTLGDNTLDDFDDEGTLGTLE